MYLSLYLLSHLMYLCISAVQILSNLHLEAPKAYSGFEIVLKAPFLALLGNVGNVVPHKDLFLDFLIRQLRLPETVKPTTPTDPMLWAFYGL